MFTICLSFIIAFTYPFYAQMLCLPNAYLLSMFIQTKCISFIIAFTNQMHIIYQCLYISILNTNVNQMFIIYYCIYKLNVYHILLHLQTKCTSYIIVYTN